MSESDLRKNIDRYKGKIFGNWTVLDIYKRKNKYNQTLYKCRCNLCGRTKVRIAKYVIQPDSPSHPFSCGCVSMGVYVIRELLNKNHIPFEEEVIFDDLRSPKGYNLRFDFVLKSNHNGKLFYYAVIEYDGLQHSNIDTFKNITKINDTDEANKKFQYYKLCDNIKEMYCVKKGLHFTRINYTRDRKLVIRQVTTYLKYIGYSNVRE